MVLVVEDEPQIQGLIAALLGKSLCCVCVPGVAAAWNELSVAHFDLVVLDIALCDGRGMTLLRRMRARGDKTPVIVVSGRATWVEACEMRHLDVAAEIAKPHLEALRQKVTEVLAASREAAGFAAIGVALDDAAAAVTRVKELAERVGFSPSGLSRWLKSRFGVGAKAYIDRRRLEKVKALLIEGRLTVQEIAETLGFCEDSHLSRWFKRLVGCPPAQFRMRHLRRVDVAGAASQPPPAHHGDLYTK